MQQMWQDMELQDNDFLQKDPALKKEAWNDIFLSTTPGCTDVVELQLQFEPGTQPIFQKFRYLNIFFFFRTRTAAGTIAT